MTEQQIEILTKHKHYWTTYQQVQMINTASEGMTELSEVHRQLTGRPINLSCGACVVDGLSTLYAMLEEQTKPL